MSSCEYKETKAVSHFPWMSVLWKMARNICLFHLPSLTSSGNTWYHHIEEWKQKNLDEMFFCPETLPSRIYKRSKTKNFHFFLVLFLVACLLFSYCQHKSSVCFMEPHCVSPSLKGHVLEWWHSSVSTLLDLWPLPVREVAGKSCRSCTGIENGGAFCWHCSLVVCNCKMKLAVLLIQKGSWNFHVCYKMPC